jgi:hypothetical protein
LRRRPPDHCRRRRHQGRPRDDRLAARYKREVRGAKVWALHNFKDATSQYTRGTTRAFVRMVRGPVWLIETGGIRSRGGLKGQARSVKRIFALARANRAIKRIYFYEWRAVRHSHWDSAFLSVTASAAWPTTRCARA